MALPFLLVLAGCSTPSVQPDSIPRQPVPDVRSPAAQRGTHLDLEGQFFLSATQSVHALARVRLVSIGKDGGTVIEHMDTHRYSQALPGEYFVCEEFGTNRLKLISASR